MVEDGVNGHLLPVGDIDGMAEAGIRILTDPSHAKALSVAARAIAMERFSIEAVVPRYEALYERVLG